MNEPQIKSFRKWKAGTFHLRKVVSDNGMLFLYSESFGVGLIRIQLDGR